MGTAPLAPFHNIIIQQATIYSTYTLCYCKGSHCGSSIQSARKCGFQKDKICPKWTVINNYEYNDERKNPQRSSGKNCPGINVW